MTDTLFPTDAAPQDRTARQGPLAPSARPISFTSESVHGIEQNLKSQTRRAIYPQPKAPGPIEQHPGKRGQWRGPEGYGDPLWKCPYGVPGDQLWIREMWARVEPHPEVDEDYSLPIIAWRIKKNPILLAYWRKRVVLLADFPDKQPEECGRGASDNQWRSPVTMPRWASRLLLEIAAVRAERVKEISPRDCEAEGIVVYRDSRVVHAGEDRRFDAIYVEEFARLWDSINGQKNPWAANPLVWAISFRRIESV